MARLSVRTKGGRISGGPITWLFVGMFYLAAWSVLAIGAVIVWIVREIVQARRKRTALNSAAATVPAPIEDAQPE